MDDFDPQAERDVLERDEAYRWAHEQAEFCAFNILDNIHELGRLERMFGLNLEQVAGEIMRAADASRANLRTL